MMPISDGKGYRVTGSGGGIFALGDATSPGSLPSLGVDLTSIVGAVPTA